MDGWMAEKSFGKETTEAKVNGEGDRKWMVVTEGELGYTHKDIIMMTILSDGDMFWELKWVLGRRRIYGWK